MPGFNPKKQSAAFGPQAFDIIKFTIGALVSTTINVAMQLLDARGNAPQGPVNFKAFLSDASTGLGLTATALTIPPVIGTNGAVIDIITTGKIFDLQTDALGRVDVNLIQSGTLTSYLVVIMPDGSQQVSGAITW